MSNPFTYAEVVRYLTGIKLVWFWSQLEASWVSSHTDEYEKTQSIQRMILFIVNWFLGSFVKWHINPHELFNAEAILVEDSRDNI